MKIIEQPVLPNCIPDTSQWLAGQGAGSWFWMAETETENRFQIKRFSPKGVLECDRVFTCNETGFQYSKPFEFTYLSHCAFCTVIQNDSKFTFGFIKD